MIPPQPFLFTPQTSIFPTYPSQKHTHSTNISFHSFTMQNTNPQKTSEPTEPMVPPPAKRLKSQPDPDQDQGLVHCPRCDSSRTKFCYYNNYSLSQPRYFCKSCRRYWTKGGTLRNIPVGGFSRKSKKIGSAAAYRRRCSELQPQAAALQYDKLPVVPNGNVISPSSSSLQLSYPESPFQLPENHDFIFEDLTIDFMERSGSGRDYESGNYFSTPMTTSGYGAVTGNIHGPGPFAETMSYYDAQYEKIINGDFDVKPKLFENGCYLGLHGSGAERDGSSGCPLGLGPSWAGLSSGFGCMSTNPPLV